MLLGLKISNIAVIEEVEVSFAPGLTVLTGETGAGKSILIDSLGLLLGARASADVVRAGCDEASVEAVFAKTPALAARLASMGLPDLSDEVSLRRVIGRTARGRVYVNGALVTVGVLSRVLHGLVDISGQHEYVSVFDPSVHRTILDRAGRAEPLLDAYHRDFAAVQEIERLKLKPGEETDLEAERRRLSGVEKLRASATLAESLLSAQDGSSLETVDRAGSALTEAAPLDPGLQEIAKSLQTARLELEEAVRRLSQYLRHLESEPDRLAEVEERLDSLRRLGRKHGCNVEALAVRKAEIEAELGNWENRRGLLEQLRPARERAEAAARANANALSSARTQAAGPLSQKVREALSQLTMNKALFEIRITQAIELGPDGLDQVEFLFSANPGDPPRPVSRVASGGESSRLLLALKQALCGADECCCYVLDEADAGVGGAVAEVVARMLTEISSHRQVLFITHLPQVAAYADHHLTIEKREHDGRSVSKVVRLQTPAARTEELARMLSGLKVTSEARGAAEALVRSARRSVRGVNARANGAQ